jgi:hypothetical protein
VTTRGPRFDRSNRCARGRSRPLAAALSLALVVGAVGCSDDGGDDDAVVTTTTAATSPDDTTAGDGGERGLPAERDRPDAPAATLVGPLTAGDGPLVTDFTADAITEAGFVEEEFAVEGTAVRYLADDPESDLPASGEFTLTEGDTADYRTRIVVRRPAEAADFNGTVVVEWLNVSGGLDANPDWVYLHEEILRGGYAWVGVSAQHIGVEGGPVAVAVAAGGDLAGKGLKAIDPERYGELSHPGDAYMYDIYTQVSRLLRTADGDDGPLGGLDPEVLVAAGESQSAFALTTYANGVQPLTQEFDAFFIHSRGGAPLPLGEPGEGVGIAQAIANPPVQVRTDLGVPSIILQTESDTLGVLGYLPARQDDSDTIRLWEVAGGAHADQYLLGAIAEGLCPTPVNDGPTHHVARAALRHLDTWARGGEAPPTADRYEIDESGGAPQYVRDDLGIVLGGIRTPTVDTPTRVESGEVAEGADIACTLMGSSLPIPQETLAERWPDTDRYLSDYEAATDAAIDAGFVLPEDREALLAEADAELFAG